MPRKKKAEEKETRVHQEPEIIEQNFEDILADRFNRYSKYIIQERALPDARDGLKPVQRRILWAMFEDGNTWNKPYHKSAKTVGNVIGNYHPHGDSSVYDAIVRLSQEWKIRTPLIDMQGNNGSIDDDPAAAMRYTEARLSKLASFLLEDIDKETVEWAPNFSDEKMEPTVLPARYPNLLVNGITGIAAGYATNIPPHNLDEVLDACIYRLSNPKSTLDELMQFVKGPDFPTGGIIMGMDGVREGLKTGKGKFQIRSKTEIVQTKTIQQIIIHEIPYEVVKSNLVRRIDDIRLNKKIDGLLDVRDESDRNGLRIVIDVKKEFDAQMILNYLFKNTDLQISYSYNVTAIVNKTPMVLGLAAILDAFLSHREDIVIRRTSFDLANKNRRSHIVDGLIQAVSILDEVIALIRASKNKADSKKKLMDAYGFTEIQAEAIVMLQLYRLSNTDIVELRKEADLLHKEIQTLKGILEDPKKRHKLMIKEFQQMKAEFDVPRKTELLEKNEDLIIDPKAMIANEQVMLSISKDGYLKRVSMRALGKSKDLGGRKEGDVLIAFGPASTLDTLVFFTDKGKFGQIPVFKIEESRWKDIGTHISSLFKTDGQEKICAAWLVEDLPQKAELFMATRKGIIKKLKTDALPGSKNRLVSVINLDADDDLRAVIPLYEDKTDVLLASASGFGLCLNPQQISLFSSKAKGIKGMKLADEDEVASGAALYESSLLLLFENGGMKRIDTLQFEPANRNTKGVKLYKPKTRQTNPLLFELLPVSSRGSFKLDLNPFEDLKASAISRRDLDSALDYPYGKEEFAFIPPLEYLHEGTFEPEVQLSLFDTPKSEPDENKDLPEKENEQEDKT